MDKPNSKLQLIAATVLVGLIATVGTAGCDRAPAWKQPGPEAVFETFLMNWFRGQNVKAFDAIVPADRAALTAPMDKLAGKLDRRHMPHPAEMLVVGRVDGPYDLEDIDLAEPLTSPPSQGQIVTVDLAYHDGHTGQARLMWGGTRWYVDLPVGVGSTQPNR